MTASSAILEEVLAAAGKVFERPVAQEDDFFALGGDSISAIELLETLEDRLRIELDPAIVYDAGNFRMLAVRIVEQFEHAT